MGIDVSVIIVSWNAREYLESCLRSLGESFDGLLCETIVVDNASSDGSAEMVLSTFPKVRMIHAGQNLGFAKANNMGIRASSGKYLFLVNSDVTFHTGSLHKIVDYLEKNENVGMLGPRVLDRNSLWQRTCVGRPTLWNSCCRALALDSLLPGFRLFSGYLGRYFDTRTPTDVDIVYGCFWCVRRSALDEVGLLDETFFMYGEDLDWPKRFRDRGWRVVYFPEAEATHYGGASSANSPIRFFIEMQRADLQYWRKHHGVLSYVIFYLICCLNHLLRWLGHGMAWLLLGCVVSERLNKARRSYRCLRWLLAGGKAQAETV